MRSPDADIRARALKRNADFSDVDRAPFDPSGRFVIDEFFLREGKLDNPGWAFFAGDARTFNIWNPDVLLATEDGVSAVTRRRCAHLMATRKVRA